MADERSGELAPLRGMAEASFAALRDSFRGERLLAAGVGIGVAFVLAGAAGTVASGYLLRGAFMPAAMLGLLAGLFIYAGLLTTYGALSRMALAAQHDHPVSLAQAYGYALPRLHILIGLPLFVLVVAVGAGSLGGYLSALAAADRTVGAVAAPVALIALFALNLLLVIGALLSHALTAPCVACLDASPAGVASRLVQIARERLGAFLAYQAAGLVVGLPLMLFTAIVFVAAFQPAVTATTSGRAAASVARQFPSSPLPDGASPTEEEPEDWVGRLQERAAWAAGIGGAPLVSAAAVLALLLLTFPLIHAASFQSAAYLSLTGDRFLAAPEGGEEADTPRRPPIVHCWRCDAINRYESDRCGKCGAALAICPHCFATNQPGQEECSACGRPVAAEHARAS